MIPLRWPGFGYADEPSRIASRMRFASSSVGTTPRSMIDRRPRLMPVRRST
jgi:hypothetical protein